MKVLLLVLDGLADRPINEFGGDTPLQAARTPNLDILADRGSNGVMYTISPGIAPSSDLAHFVMFGYAANDYPGRGYIEALGEGLDLGEDDVVLRTSFIRVDEIDGVFRITKREIEGEEEVGNKAASLIRDTIIEGVKLRFMYTGARQGLLVMTGAVSPEVTDSDPLAVGLPVVQVRPWDEAGDREAAIRTARALNEFMLECYEAIKEQDLNFLIVKWPGRKTNIRSLYDRCSFKGVSVAEGPLYKGLAKAIGIDFYESPYDDIPRIDLERRLNKAKDLLQEGYDFVHVHTKVPDHAGHTKDPVFKRDQIQELDSALSILVDDGGLFEDTLLVVTADHATPSTGDLIHSGEATPLVMVGPNIKSDQARVYDELSCRSGSIGVITGGDLMHTILNCTDRIRYSGSRCFSFDSPARPTADRLTPLYKGSQLGIK